MDALEYIRFLREPYQQSKRQTEQTNREFLRFGERRSKQLGRHLGEIYRDSVKRNIDRRDETERLFIENMVNPFKNLIPENVRMRLRVVPVAILPIRTLSALSMRAPDGEPRSAPPSP